MSAMVTIIIRNLVEWVAERLKLPSEGTKTSRKELVEQACAMRARLKLDPTPAADYIREDRDRL